MPGYFFVGGAPKSGTTWMQRALDLHPEIVCSGEGHLHEFIVRPLFEVIKKYNAKLAVVADAVYEGRPYYPEVSRSELLDITRAVMKLLMGRRSKPGVRLIGDKTPANVQVLADLVMLFPDMKFVFMLRDPRDVAASRLAHARRNGHAEVEDRNSQLYRDVVRAAAVDWRCAVERARAFAAGRPQQMATVRYEDLLADPSRELGRVFDMLGARTKPRELAEIVRASSFEALSGGRRPGQEDSGSFYRKGVVGDWRNRLNAQALEILVAECGPAMREAGYDDSGQDAARPAAGAVGSGDGGQPPQGDSAPARASSTVKTA